MNRPSSFAPSTGPAEPESMRRGYRMAVRTAAVAGFFTLLAAGVLLLDYFRRPQEDPLEEQTYATLRAVYLALEDPDLKLAEDPQLNERLKTKYREEVGAQIKQLDLKLRQEYFRQRNFAYAGAFLLLAGMIVTAGAAMAAGALRRRLPQIEPQSSRSDPHEPVARISRWAVAGVAVVLAAGVAVAAMSLQSRLPPRSIESAANKADDKADKAATDAPRQAIGGPAPPDFPSADELAENWYRFRGPQGAGISPFEDAPTQWDEAEGKGIRWKTPVPLPGFNSPVVWSDRVFLTGATEDRREDYCFDADSGELLWQKEPEPTPQTPQEPPKVEEYTGYAAPTAVTDGRRVYAIFANGELAAFDFEGTQPWGRSFGLPKNMYGHASSLALFEDKVLVLLDQGSRKDDLSKLYAVNAASGEIDWQVDRQVPNSWTSPIVVRDGDVPLLITAADPFAIAYDPRDGTERWRAKVLQGDVGPSPTYADGIAYLVNEFPALSAVRVDGRGDVTDSHVLWQVEFGLPNTTSPLATPEMVIMMDPYGILTAYDAKEGGEPLWEEEFLDATFTSSPAMVGDRLYLFGEIESEEQDEDGEPVMHTRCYIVRVSKQGCERLGTSDFQEGCVTSPAFQPGRIYIRGKGHLYCLQDEATMNETNEESAAEESTTAASRPPNRFSPTP